jgi:hypothetical protein
MKYACSHPEHAGRRYVVWGRIKCYLPTELRSGSSSTVPGMQRVLSRRRKASQAHEAAQPVQRSMRAAAALHEACAPPRPHKVSSDLLRLAPQLALPSKRVRIAIGEANKQQSDSPVLRSSEIGNSVVFQSSLFVGAQTAIFR